MSLESYEKLMSSNGFMSERVKIGKESILSFKRGSDKELRIFFTDNIIQSVRLKSLTEKLEIVPKFIIRTSIRLMNNQFLLQKTRIFECRDNLRHQIINSFKLGIEKTFQCFDQLQNKIRKDCEEFKQDPEIWIRKYDPKSLRKLEKVNFVQKSNLFLDMDSSEYTRRFGVMPSCNDFMFRILISPPCDWDTKHHIRAIRMDPANNNILMMIERDDDCSDLKELIDNFINGFTPNMSRICNTSMDGSEERDEDRPSDFFKGLEADKTAIVPKTQILKLKNQIEIDEMLVNPSELSNQNDPILVKSLFMPEPMILVAEDKKSENVHLAYTEVSIKFDEFY